LKPRRSTTKLSPDLKGSKPDTPEQDVIRFAESTQRRFARLSAENTARRSPLLTTKLFVSTRNTKLARTLLTRNARRTQSNGARTTATNAPDVFA
jgi:hypothetical protein